MPIIFEKSVPSRRGVKLSDCDVPASEPIDEQYRRAADRFKKFVAAGEPATLVPFARYLEANSLLRIGKLDESSRRYKAFLAAGPDATMAVSAMYQAGLAAMMLGR